MYFYVLLLIFLNIQFACKAGRVMDMQVTTLEVVNAPNPYMYIDNDRACGLGPNPDIKFVSVSEVLQPLTEDDSFEVEYNLEIERWRQRQSLDSGKDLSLCSTDSDTKGSIAKLIRRVLGLEDECPISVGIKKTPENLFTQANFNTPNTDPCSTDYFTITVTKDNYSITTVEGYLYPSGCPGRKKK